jgi:hypothetical protein
MAYMMSGTDGANKTPKALALVTKPMPRFSGYPAFINKGNSKPPKANIVTPLPPVKAVKQEHSKAVATTVPLAPCPSRATNKVPNLWAAPVRANTKPAKVNKGKAGKDGFTVIW